ncbi:MAG TPA: HPF/RaiA family ribosome-associated protein [Candidatus Paceibacterota bacterium]|nr:HPF/RaiA family ribosome-associated protein [Candidatus Paceibacterota bacterium]
MDMRIKATEMKLSPTTGRYLDEKLAHIEKMLGADSELARCEVELGRDAGRPRHGANIFFAEITLMRPGRDDLRATNHSESLHGAIDDVQSEIARQVRSNKRVAMRGSRKKGREVKRLMQKEA